MHPGGAQMIHLEAADTMDFTAEAAGDYLLEERRKNTNYNTTATLFTGDFLFAILYRRDNKSSLEHYQRKLEFLLAGIP